MVVNVQKRSLVLTYLKLGYLLHLMTLAEVFIIIRFFQNVEISTWLQDEFMVLKLIFLLLFVTAPLFPQCDARSRFQNYKQVKDHFYLYGFQGRIVKPFLFSRCQRDAVIVAAEELGMQSECKQYFKKMGYHWYHLLPSFLFHRPAYLFHKAFWLNTFFAKYYASKINFSAIPNKRILLDVRIRKKEISYSFSSGSII
jgi:hypothetical protein